MKANAKALLMSHVYRNVDHDMATPVRPERRATDRPPTEPLPPWWAATFFLWAPVVLTAVFLLWDFFQ